jgi:predicted nuclease of predicted toxin-antitoxin system
MKGASDEEIVRKAVEEKRVIVTNDKYEVLFLLAISFSK